MKKHGILNAQLAGLIASLGHKDTFMLGDAGMPIPRGVELVDLAVTANVPRFVDVLHAVLEETCIEGATLAEEIQTQNSQLHQVLLSALENVPFDYVPHEQLKELSRGCRFAIRTGEFSPYPNVILRAGVTF